MINAILTDIEGTTSSLSFVKDVLFPYARERMTDFVRTHGQESAVRKLLDEVKQLSGAVNDTDVTRQLMRWIDEDKKVTPLKALQGMIWEEGYRQGHFKGHVYEDAARKLKEWHAQGVKLYVFSSGSVQAQKLLFAHTDYGDLTPLFSGYFDTTIGNKRDPSAYQAIAREIALPPDEILFLSDIAEELEAARKAGIAAAQVAREDNVNAHAPSKIVANFDAINLTVGTQT